MMREQSSRTSHSVLTFASSCSNLRISVRGLNRGGEHTFPPFAATCSPLPFLIFARTYRLTTSSARLKDAGSFMSVRARACEEGNAS
jgi:hypothetical protein